MPKKNTEKEAVANSTQIRHDPAHCLAPGLFRSLRSGERQVGKRNLSLNITYKYSKDERIEFVGPEPLGVDDMRILQGLISLAGQESTVFSLTPEIGTDIQQRLAVLLSPKHEALTQKALMVRCRISTLITEIGMKNSGQTIKHVYKCLKRMSYVSIGITKGKHWAITHLMSTDADETGKSLVVALNPLIAKAIIGHQHYTRIDMAEVRALKTDPARLIHQRFCGWINPGGEGKVSLFTVCEYIWTEETSNNNTFRRRKMIARQALSALKELGWGINEYGQEKYLIARP